MISLVQIVVAVVRYTLTKRRVDNNFVTLNLLKKT